MVDVDPAALAKLDVALAKTASGAASVLSNTSAARKILASLLVSPAPASAPVPAPTPTPVPVGPQAPAQAVVPAGMKRLRSFDLRVDEGWERDSGKPSNADSADRPDNGGFGSGPDANAMRLWFNRDAQGKLWSADFKAKFCPIPSIHAGELWYSHDEISPLIQGPWPCPGWLRPLDGSIGEIDLLETFASHLVNGKGWPVTAATLHDTNPLPAPAPYNLAQKQAKLPQAIAGGVKRRLQWWVTPEAFTVILDGTIAVITGAQFDAVAGAGKYASVIAVPDKRWYFRSTVQMGGSEGGAITPELTSWGMTIHSIDLFIPA